MRAIKRQIAVVAPRNSWVLITGQNGTGKEVVARNIHLASRRVDKPFVAVTVLQFLRNLSRVSCSVMLEGLSQALRVTNEVSSS